ncbi:MAG: HRDC domain-containing protein, partial [Micrococcales bacterium]|nr:HRDC domain-containing protein [Micrococcales bacterium]
PISMAESPAEIEEERRLLYVGLTRARRHLRLSWAGARAPGGRATRRPSRFLESTGAILGDQAVRPESARGPRGTRASGTRPGAVRPKPARRCRVCGGELTTAAQRKVGRCTGCAPTYDEATFERLKAWRLAQSRAASVPAYVVFTDATLTVIAEREPHDLQQLATISGVGARKLERYGLAVIAVLGGADPADLIATPQLSPTTAQAQTDTPETAESEVAAGTFEDALLSPPSGAPE